MNTLHKVLTKAKQYAIEETTAAQLAEEHSYLDKDWRCMRKCIFSVCNVCTKSHGQTWPIMNLIWALFSLYDKKMKMDTAMCNESL